MKNKVENLETLAQTKFLSLYNANYTKYSLYYSCSSNSTFMLNSSN